MEVFLPAEVASFCQVNAEAECLHVMFYSSLTVSQISLLIIFSNIHQKIN